MQKKSTDYQEKVRRPWIKRVVIRLLGVTWLNRIIVAMLWRLPSVRWRSRLPVVAGVGRYQASDNAVIELLHAERCELSKELYWGKGRLASAADNLSLQLAMCLSKEANLFLDVGAYTGLFALAVARRNANIRCHAYEIVPENFQYLWENVLHNDLVDRVEPRLMGVADQQDTIKVPLSLGEGVLASSVALDSSTPAGIRIPVDSLDHLYGKSDLRVVMKIDVEGFEYPVLVGGKGEFLKSKPDIICEVLTRAPNIPDVANLLRGEGYRFFHIRNDGLHCADEIQPMKTARDWLFTTREADELAALGISVFT